MDYLIFNEYIEKYSPALTRLCFLLCGNRYDAEDLFQETWLRAMKKYDKFRQKSSFEKWICRICVNIYKDTQKSPYIKRRMGFGCNEDQELFISSIPDRTVPDEKYIELLECIRELPEKYRTVIALRYFSDYSEKETAEILRIPAGTVKSRLNKAKSVIKRRIQNE